MNEYRFTIYRSHTLAGERAPEGKAAQTRGYESVIDKDSAIARANYLATLPTVLRVELHRCEYGNGNSLRHRFVHRVEANA